MLISNESRGDILPLARNGLSLTMIVRVHFGLGALPDSRLDLYAKCAETLLEQWAEAAGLAPSPIDFHQKHKLLEQLAYEMQERPNARIRKCRCRFRARMWPGVSNGTFKDTGSADASRLVERVIHRLHARDGILVQFGTDQRGQDQFCFVHRSFQEFAVCWMAQELDEADWLFQDREGWNETLYLAVAQLPDSRRRKALQESLKKGRAEFAIQCLRAAPPNARGAKGAGHLHRDRKKSV